MSFIINPYSFGFNPLSLSPALWLDANDASTLYDATTGGSLVAPNGTVARWEDKSGNAKHATQATAVNRPLRKTSVANSKDALLYDATDKLVCSLALNANFTVIIAGRRNSGTNACAFVGNLQNTGNADGIMIGHFDTGSNNNCAAALMRVSNTGTNTSRVNVGNTSFVASVLVQSTSYTGWINGGNESTITAVYSGRDTSLTIGSPRTGEASQSPVGNIFEVLVFPTALSATNRQAVETYLRIKWGTP